MAPVETDVKLQRMYLNKRHRGSFTGATTFYDSLPESLKRLKYPTILKALEGIKAYAQNRPAPRRFPRRKVVVPTIDSQWQVDLVCLPRLASFNNSYKYIFMCIDVLSKYLWAVPMKTKTAQESLKALKLILRQSGRKPKKIQCDEGTEFKSVFQSYCESNGISIFHVYSELKACIIERTNATILQRLWRFMQHKNIFTWYKVLPDIVRNYNATKHHSTKYRPKDITEENAMDVWMNLYGKYNPEATTKPKFNLNDTVYVSILKNKMEKGYERKFKDKVYYVDRITNTNPRMYHLRDDQGRPLPGAFYPKELSRIRLKER